MKWYKYCWITKDPGLCNPKTNGVFHSLEENNLVEEEPLVTTTPCTTTTTEATTTTTEMTTTLLPVQLVPIIEEPKPVENLQVRAKPFSKSFLHFWL